jgi:hypothetical protein
MSFRCRTDWALDPDLPLRDFGMALNFQTEKGSLRGGIDG